MKNEIKQKLLKEFTNEDGDGCGCGACLRNLIDKTIEETSKAKDEEFIKILDEKIKNHNCLESDSVCMSCWVCHHFFELKEEIKQKMEDLEEKE